MCNLCHTLLKTHYIVTHRKKAKQNNSRPLLACITHNARLKTHYIVTHSKSPRSPEDKKQKD